MMKKIFTGVIVFTMISLMFINTFAEGNEDKKYSSILVLGDSISSGYGLDGYDVDKDNIPSYCNLIRDELKPDTYNNFALNGQTSSQLLEKLKNGEYDENIKDANLILITIGGNDILGKFVSSIKEMFKDIDGNYQIINTDENILKSIMDKIVSSQNQEEYDKISEKFKSNFIELVQYINEKNPDAKLYFQTVYNPFSGVFYLSQIDELAEKYTAMVNETIKNNTKDENGNTLYEYIDVADFFYLRAYQLTNIFRFDIHPNSTGHQMIYQMLSNALNSTETDLLQVLDPMNEPERVNENVSNTTTVSETTPNETTIVTAEQTDNDISNDNQILVLVILTASLISIAFLYVVLNKKTR